MTNKKPAVFVTSAFGLACRIAHWSGNVMGIFLGSFTPPNYAQLRARDCSLVSVETPSEKKFETPQAIAKYLAQQICWAIDDMARCRARNCFTIDRASRLAEHGATMRPSAEFISVFYMDSSWNIYHRAGNLAYTFMCEGLLIAKPLPIAKAQARILAKVDSLRNELANPKKLIPVRVEDATVNLLPIGMPFLHNAGILVIDSSPTHAMPFLAPLEQDPQKYSFIYTMQCCVELSLEESIPWIEANEGFFMSAFAVVYLVAHSTSELDAIEAFLRILSQMHHPTKSLSLRICFVADDEKLMLVIKTRFQKNFPSIYQLLQFYQSTADTALESVVLAKRPPPISASGGVTIAYVKLGQPHVQFTPTAKTPLPGITGRENLELYGQNTAWIIRDFLSLDECFTRHVSHLAPRAESLIAAKMPVEELFRGDKIVIDCLTCDLDNATVTAIIDFVSATRKILIRNEKGVVVHYVSAEIAILVPANRIELTNKLSDAFLGHPWDYSCSNTYVCIESISLFFFSTKSLEQRTMEILESSAHSPLTRGQEFAREEFMNARDFPSQKGLLHTLVSTNRRFVAINELADYVLATAVHHKRFLLVGEGKALLSYISMKDKLGRTPLHECARSQDTEIRRVVNKWSGPGVVLEADRNGFTAPAIETATPKCGLIIKTEHLASVYLFVLGNDLGKDLPNLEKLPYDLKACAVSKEYCHYCEQPFTYVDAALGIVTNSSGIISMNNLLTPYMNRRANMAGNEAPKDDEGFEKPDKPAVFFHRKCMEKLFAGFIVKKIPEPKVLDDEMPFSPFENEWRFPKRNCPNCGKFNNVFLFQKEGQPAFAWCRDCWDDVRTVVHPIPFESRWNLKGNKIARYRGGGTYVTTGGQSKFSREGMGGFFVSPRETAGARVVDFPSFVTREAWNELKAVVTQNQQQTMSGELFEFGLYVNDTLLIHADSLCKTPNKLFESFLFYGPPPYPTASPINSNSNDKKKTGSN
jgi:hypothetical protein